MGKKTSGLPPFHEDLKKMLGVDKQQESSSPSAAEKLYHQVAEQMKAQFAGSKVEDLQKIVEKKLGLYDDDELPGYHIDEIKQIADEVIVSLKLGLPVGYIPVSFEVTPEKVQEFKKKWEAEYMTKKLGQAIAPKHLAPHSLLITPDTFLAHKEKFYISGKAQGSAVFKAYQNQEFDEAQKALESGLGVPKEFLSVPESQAESFKNFVGTVSGKLSSCGHSQQNIPKSQNPCKEVLLKGYDGMPGIAPGKKEQWHVQENPTAFGYILKQSFGPIEISLPVDNGVGGLSGAIFKALNNAFPVHKVVNIVDLTTEFKIKGLSGVKAVFEITWQTKSETMTSQEKMAHQINKNIMFGQMYGASPVMMHDPGWTKQYINADWSYGPDESVIAAAKEDIKKSKSFKPCPVCKQPNGSCKHTSKNVAKAPKHVMKGAHKPIVKWPSPPSDFWGDSKKGDDYSAIEDLKMAQIAKEMQLQQDAEFMQQMMSLKNSYAPPNGPITEGYANKISEKQKFLDALKVKYEAADPSKSPNEEALQKMYADALNTQIQQKAPNYHIQAEKVSAQALNQIFDDAYAKMGNLGMGAGMLGGVYSQPLPQTLPKGAKMAVSFLVSKYKELRMKVESGQLSWAEAEVFFAHYLPVGAPEPPIGIWGAYETASEYFTALKNGQHVSVDKLIGHSGADFDEEGVAHDEDFLALVEENPLLEYEELVEITLTGLTRKEAEHVLKTYGKSKAGPVMTSKKVRKELSTKEPPIVTWAFESSSMQVNGNPIMYAAQLNKDSTLSCNCQGWCIEKKNPDGTAKPRTCKHVKEIASEAAEVFKKWKAGKPFGEEYETVSLDVAMASSKEMSIKLKEKKTPTDGGVMMAKRVLDI
jgi:hypothetical protein